MLLDSNSDKGARSNSAHSRDNFLFYAPHPLSTTWLQVCGLSLKFFESLERGRAATIVAARRQHPSLGPARVTVRGPTSPPAASKGSFQVKCNITERCLINLPQQVTLARLLQRVAPLLAQC